MLLKLCYFKVLLNVAYNLFSQCIMKCCLYHVLICIMKCWLHSVITKYYEMLFNSFITMYYEMCNSIISKYLLKKAWSFETE